MWISLALKNNHDIKMFIVQLLDTLGVIFYLSWYSTKAGLNCYNIVELAEIALKNLNKYNENANLEDNARKFISKCYNAMVNHTEYSGAQVGAMLLNVGRDGTYMSSHLTETLFVHNLINELNAEHSNENDYLNLMHSDQTENYNTYDYLHRPVTLETICLYQYVSEYKKYRSINLNNKTNFQFKNTHCQFSTHLCRHKLYFEIPNYYGPQIPHKSSEEINEKILYCKIMLILFKPFRKVCEFKISNENIIMLYLDFYNKITAENNNFILNKLNNINDMRKGQDDVNSEKKIHKMKVYTNDILKYEDIFSSSDDDNDYDEDDVHNLVDEFKKQDLVNLSKNHGHNHYKISELDNKLLFFTYNHKFDYIKNWKREVKGYNDNLNSINIDDTDFRFDMSYSCDPKILEQFLKSSGNNVVDFIVTNFKLNFEQKIAFELFVEKFFNIDVEQKLINVSGSGGCGKSEIIKAIQHFFMLNNAGDQLLCIAYTGGAANTINGKFLL